MKLALCLVTACACCLPLAAWAQDDDPCLKTLAGQKELIEKYDRLVGSYLEALDDGKPGKQLLFLNELWTICQDNLRLKVFMGDALSELDQCTAGAEQYLWVLDRADGWKHANNAKDAKKRASKALEDAKCVASVQVTCASSGATVQIGDRTPQPCPATILVPEGEYEVLVAAENAKPVQRTYTFEGGNNAVAIEALVALVNPGWIEFACGAEGTEISVESQRFACPAKVAFEAGTVAFTAYRPDGTMFSGSTRIEAGATASIDVPAEGEQSGSMSVTCVPAGAKVTISGGQLNMPIVQYCPFTAPLMPGDYQLAIEAQGYTPTSKTAKVVAGTPLNLSVELEGGPSAVSFFVRALGGAGFIKDVDTPTGVAHLGGYVGFLGDPALISIGVVARLGIGEGFGGLGGLGFDYIQHFGGFDFFLGGLVGYGTLGIAEDCSYLERNGICYDEDGFEEESSSEEAAFAYSFWTGLGLPVGDTLRLLVAVGWTGKGGDSVIDALAGLDVNF